MLFGPYPPWIWFEKRIEDLTQAPEAEVLSQATNIVIYIGQESYSRITRRTPKSHHSQAQSPPTLPTCRHPRTISPTKPSQLGRYLSLFFCERPVSILSMHSRFVIMCLLMAGCMNTPPNPYRDSEAYLRARKPLLSEEEMASFVALRPLPDGTLTILSTSGSDDVRSMVALNKGSRPELLNRLGQDPATYVRVCVAANRRTSLATITALLGDQDSTVRHTATRSPTLPAESLRKLFQSDQSHNVDFSMNPNCPPDIMHAIAASNDSLARIWLAANPSLDETTILVLEGDKDDLVRQYLARNSVVSALVLRRLSHDANAAVRNAATTTLTEKFDVK